MDNDPDTRNKDREGVDTEVEATGMTYRFSHSSLTHLMTAHPELQKLFTEIIRYRDCSVLCGHRGKNEQDAAFLSGNSKAQWGESPHNKYPSMAVDVVPYPVDWENKEAFHEFAGFVMGVASQLHINIKWGGHFIVDGEPYFDGPHYELED